MASTTAAYGIPVPVEGVRPDLHPRDLPPTALREAQNWVYRDGLYRTRDGFTAYGTNTSHRPMGFVDYVHNDAARRLVMGTTLGWWKYNSGTAQWVNITNTALTGTSTDQVVFRVFDKAGVRYLLGVNGANTMKKWNGTDATYAEVGGSPPKAKCMVIANDSVVLFNLLDGSTISGSAYACSNNKDFDAGWGTRLIGILVDTPGDIVSALEFGPLQSAIYKTDAIYMMYAQGDAIAPFRFELKSAAVSGPVSALAACQVADGLHAFLSADGAIRLFDGVETRSVGYSVQKYIADRMDPTAANRSFGFFDREYNELYFFFTEYGSSEPNHFVVVNIASGALWPQRLPSTLRMTAGQKVSLTTPLTYGEVLGGYGDLDKTYGDFDQPLRKILVGEKGGLTYTHSGSTDAGTNIASYFETWLHDGGSPESWKTLVEIEHLIPPTNSEQTLSLQIGTSTSREDRVLQAAQFMTVGATRLPPYRTGHRVSARNLSYRLSTEVAERVVWGGAIAHGAGRGLR